MSATDRIDRLVEALDADHRAIFESFRRAFGMTAEQALRATVGRDGRLPAGEPHDRLTEAFRGMGLSESAAQAAASHRRPAQARADLRDAARGHVRATSAQGPSGPARTLAQERALREVVRRADGDTTSATFTRDMSALNRLVADHEGTGIEFTEALRRAEYDIRQRGDQ